MEAYPRAINNYDLLYSLHVEQRLSSREIAKLLPPNERTIRTWLKIFGLLRNHKEAGAISATRYLSKQVSVVCSTCGREVMVQLCRTKRAKQLYCSRDCQIQDYEASLGKATRTYRNRHPRVTKICRVCGASFTVPFSERNRRKHCSDQCKGVTQMLSLAAKQTPNRIEQRIIDITTKHFPDFKYNGNGNLGVVLGGMIPDFVNVNGQKKVIEVFGDYYHGKLAKRWKDTELGKGMAYSYLGYRCLVIWEREIKTKTDDELVAIIRQFSSSKSRGGTP